MASRLLSQKTYKGEETVSTVNNGYYHTNVCLSPLLQPLMIAASRGSVGAVKTLLSSGIDAVKQSITMRNASGSMPLHVAVSSCFSQICSALLEASDGSDIVHTENGVGETPLETATVKWLVAASTNEYKGKLPHGYSNLEKLPTFPGRVSVFEPGPPDAETIAKEIENLQAVKATLADRGKLMTNKKLGDAIDSFLIYLEEKRATAPGKEASDKPNDDKKRDTYDHKRTYEVILAAVQQSTGKRSLVHLADVQRSVLHSLGSAQAKLKQDQLNNYVNEYDYRRRFKKGKEIPNEAEAEAVQKQLQWNGVMGWSQNCRYNFN